MQASGTEGYVEEIDRLVRRFESISFAGLHGPILHLIPKPPCSILDIGSGSGRDAAAFAAMGHRLVAVEPSAGLRERAAALHPSPGIEWVDDSLPDLAVLARRGDHFDAVMLTAVWMHLDAEQRRRGMPRVASFVRQGGVAIVTLRHGPVPPGRRMFDVTARETERLAAAEGLGLKLKLEDQPGYSGRPDVKWTVLAFVKGA
ncbi:MAG TPA: class I SAM-dependent methyltransferase [Dongiaceae bacterium]